jgi:hypothetical protein
MGLNTADITFYVNIIGNISHKFSEHAFVKSENSKPVIVIGDKNSK